MVRDPAEAGRGSIKKTVPCRLYYEDWFDGSIWLFKLCSTKRFSHKYLHILSQWLAYILLITIIFTPPAIDLCLTNILTQVPALFNSTSLCIQEQCHLQPDHRRQRDTAGYRCWRLWCWRGDQSIESNGKPLGHSETSAGQRKWWKLLVLDCGRQQLHCSVGEAQAGIQEHPSLVMAGVGF